MKRLSGYTLLLLVFPSLAVFINTTVDDNSSLITYSGAWPESRDEHRNQLDYGGAHMVSTVDTDTATFKFTGVAVYYLSPLWPYNVTTSISLDGGEAIVVNLTDLIASPTPPGGSESSPYDIRWHASGLANTSHVIVVSMAKGSGFVIVDAFIYTSSDGSSTSGSDIDNGTGSTNASSFSNLTKKSNILPAILGAVFGAIFLAIILLCIWYCRRRRLRRTPPCPSMLFPLDDSELPGSPRPLMASIEGTHSRACSHQRQHSTCCSTNLSDIRSSSMTCCSTPTSHPLDPHETVGYPFPTSRKSRQIPAQSYHSHHGSYHDEVPVPEAGPSSRSTPHSAPSRSYVDEKRAQREAVAAHSRETNDVAPPAYSYE